MNVNNIYEEYRHYKVFEKIYSIKDILHKNTDELCQLCFYNNIDYYEDNDEIDEIIDINIIICDNLSKGSEYLCNNCKYCIYTKSDIINLVQEILNDVYKYKGDEEFRKFISFFDGYVINPYEKLLCEYLNNNMSNLYYYHQNCNHLIDHNDDPNILCEYILDIINKIDDIYFTPFIKICPVKYIEIFIKRGIDINHVFDNDTVFTSLLYGFIDSPTHDDRISKLISLGADVNKCNPIKEITGIQYEDRPYKVNKIKYLISIGVNFEECKTNEKLLNTRLSKLINELI